MLFSPLLILGLPYAIHGSATIVNKNVAIYLSAAQDPIKSILGVEVHKERKIIVKRRGFCAGFCGLLYLYIITNI